MAEYLTAKQVISLLKIDRTTLYRMLREDRIRGVKIGSHWRFPQEAVNDLMQGRIPEPSITENNIKDELPIHCIQPIQEVFSDIINIAALTTDAGGNPITEISNSCSFCNLILESEKGRAACINSWKSLRFSQKGHAVINTCHAGLNYSGANIVLDGIDKAKIITGQFYLDSPGEKRKEEIEELADNYGIDKDKLLKASEEIKVIDENVRPQLGTWLYKIAKSFERIGNERKELISKLRNIAEISSL